MANKPHTDCALPWASITTEIHNLKRAVCEAPPQERDALEREIVRLQDELMAKPAPSLLGVVEKLCILWSAELGSGQDGRERQLILDDVHRLIGVTA